MTRKSSAKPPSPFRYFQPRADAHNIGGDIRSAPHRSWFAPDTAHVSADSGKVKLTGSVDTPGESRTAAATTWTAAGTTDVVNQLFIGQTNTETPPICIEQVGGRFVVRPSTAACDLRSFRRCRSGLLC